MTRPTLVPDTAVPASSPQLWTCTKCGTVDRWGPGWKWWGNYNATGRENVDAVHCPSCPAPKDGPR